MLPASHPEREVATFAGGEGHIYPDFASRVRFARNVTRRDASLQIAGLRASDAGVYTCKVKFGTFIKQETIRLTVLDLSAGKAPLSCPPGCSVCSAANGCLQCAPRLFLHLQRLGMRQLGRCLLACPAGHYGKGGGVIGPRCLRELRPLLNALLEMRVPIACSCQVPHCDSCYGQSSCERCSRGHFQHRGRCVTSCPSGYEGNSLTQGCLPAASC
ncbi:R-spondin-3-like [Petromyzon marinus]|uniref:R-spondin-3-like n=1 Tax=Petromyzon marinus TaxID=7757 RepID=UPI003F6EA2D4